MEIPTRFCGLQNGVFNMTNKFTLAQMGIRLVNWWGVVGRSLQVSDGEASYNGSTISLASVATMELEKCQIKYFKVIIRLILGIAANLLLLAFFQYIGETYCGNYVEAAILTAACLTAIYYNTRFWCRREAVCRVSLSAEGTGRLVIDVYGFYWAQILMALLRCLKNVAAAAGK